MKQVLQDLKTGSVIVAETPDPSPATGRVLVRVQASVVSAGTESAQVARARQTLLARVRQKPDLIRQGLAEWRERGLAGVREKVAGKYEGYAELGYSCAGTVVHVGDAEHSITPGTLVACGGAGLANHAEFVSVPPLLTAAAPDGVTAEAAAYATVGAIALQGVRQSQAQLGEYIAVIGLGLIGLITVQLLRAAGCRVVGLDPSAGARQRGQALGCDAVADPGQGAEAMLATSGGIGADAVIICAATSESSPVELAGRLARSRGRVVMVGATGMTIPREEYYLKELSFRLSRSYGPGRYDRAYEEEGHDYPLDHVRFTEQRNMRAILELVQQGRVNTAALTTHRFSVDDAPAAYALLGDRAADRAGIVLQYAPAGPAPRRFVMAVRPAALVSSEALGVGFIGAGAYAQGMLLPLLRGRADTALRCVMTRQGSHALHAAQRFGFEKVCTRVEDVLENPSVQLVFITTRHDTHAALVCDALRAGKHVWVEKPLALSVEELREVWAALRDHPASRLVVGFNRPFSPAARWLLGRLESASPRLLRYRVNAGQVPADSWVNQPKVGGGRLIGEGCHFFDFLRHAAGAPAETVQVVPCLADRADWSPTANFAATIGFANGAVGQLLYSAQGAAGMGKEHIECFTGERCGAIHDFRDAEFFHRDHRERWGRHAQDKGQAGLLTAFLDSLRQGAPPPMRPEDLLESSLLTLAAQQSLVSCEPARLCEWRRQIP